jgi:hypothetical protein
MTNARDKANIPVLNFQSKGIDDNADATAITIDSSERVGLNTTTPGAKLEINSTGNYYNTANQHQQWSYNGTPFLSLYMDAYASPYFDTDSTSSWNPGATMVFKRQGSEKMRITSDGKIGIGTSNPSEQIEISGTGTQTLKIDRTDASSSGAITINSANNSNYIYNLTSKNLILGTDNNARLTVDGTGNVGINTISPDHLLHISASSSNSQLKLQRTGSATASYNISASSDALAFSNQVAGSEVMRINSTGLGIGESSPLGKLHVKTGESSSSVHASANEVIVEGSANTGISILSGNSNEGAIYFGDDGNNDVGRIRYLHNTNQMDFTTNGGIRASINSSGQVGIGTTSPSRTLSVFDSTPIVALYNSTTGTGNSDGFQLQLSSDDGYLWNYESGGNVIFGSGGSERMRINSSGDLLIGKTTNAFNELGTTIRAGDEPMYITRDNNYVILVNRKSSDGDLVRFYKSTSQKGSISVSGETVSYNGFTGSHWSRFTDNSKPTILRGTVLETLDEMLDWYNLEYNITTTTKDEDGNDVTNTETFGVPHVLTDSQSVGDTITYNHEGTDVQATIVKEADVKHMMSKVSDTTDAKNVYGVFNCYDEEQSEEGYNDFLVASVGSFVVRIKSGETIAKGDLLQSNGDGTAKVQIDDNVKSSSFAKVLSTTIIETYEDGSYLVPCSLNC